MKVTVNQTPRAILDYGKPGVADKSFLYVTSKPHRFVVIKGPTDLALRNTFERHSFLLIGEVHRYISEDVPRVHSFEDLLSLLRPATPVVRGILMT